MSSIEKFTAKLQVFGENIESKSRATHKEIIADAHGRVVERTPVDTGRAKNGWKPKFTWPKGGTYNNVKYIGVLEKGHSKQAPNGMAKITVEELKAKYEL